MHLYKIIVFFLLSFTGFSAGVLAEKTGSCGPVYEGIKPEPWETAYFLERALPSSKAPLFGERDPIEFKLTADLKRVKNTNEGNWTGEDRTANKYWTKAMVALLAKDSKSLSARVRGRGMSSASDSEFPKLRLEISDETEGTVFKGAKNLRINTHVSTNPKTEWTEMGRLNDERSPYREALGFEIAQAMGLPTPAFRRAQITYVDTGSKKIFSKQALLIETDKKIGERFGAAAFETIPKEDNNVDVRLGAIYHLYQVLIGNDDVGLRLKMEPAFGTEKYRPLFNTLLFEKDKKLFPVVYDLDLATLLRGFELPKYDGMKLPEFGIEDGRLAWMTNRLAGLRSRLSKEEYETVLQDYFSREAHIRTVIAGSRVDEAGRQNALAHLDLFRKAVDKLKDAPMLLKENVGFFEDAALTKNLLKPMPASGRDPYLMPGVPVKVIAREGNVVKVAVMDPRQYLEDFKSHVGYIKAEDLELGFDLPPALQGHIDERDITW